MGVFLLVESTILVSLRREEEEERSAGVATPPKQAVGPELVLHEVIKVHGFSNF